MIHIHGKPYFYRPPSLCFLVLLRLRNKKVNQHTLKDRASMSSYRYVVTLRPLFVLMVTLSWKQGYSFLHSGALELARQSQGSIISVRLDDSVTHVVEWKVET